MSDLFLLVSGIIIFVTMMSFITLIGKKLRPSVAGVMWAIALFTLAISVLFI